MADEERDREDEVGWVDEVGDEDEEVEDSVTTTVEPNGGLVGAGVDGI